MPFNLHSYLFNTHRRVSELRESVFATHRRVSEPRERVFDTHRRVSEPRERVFDTHRRVSEPRERVFGTHRRVLEPRERVFDTHQSFATVDHLHSHYHQQSLASAETAQQALGNGYALPQLIFLNSQQHNEPVLHQFLLEDLETG